MPFKSKHLDLIREVGGLAVTAFTQQLEAYIEAHVQIQAQSEPVDISFLRFIANVVENSLEKKSRVDNKIDKKKVVLDTYIRLKEKAGVAIAPEQRVALESVLEDLHSTGQIKKVSWKKVLWSAFKKRVLA